MIKGRVSVIIVTYNSERDIEECIDSLEKQKYPDLEIIVVDNASSDETIDIIKNKFPNVKLIQAQRNIGYGRANNLGYRRSSGEYLLILNPDTVIRDPYMVNKLVKELRNSNDVFAVTPKIKLYQNEELINCKGNSVHFVGFVFSKDIFKKDQNDEGPEFVFSPSGCCFMIKRKLVDKVGLFNKEFYLRHEVPELAWRFFKLGFKCKYVPFTCVYHKYRFKMSPMWFYLSERGRYLLLSHGYSPYTLRILLPAIIFSEILTWFFAIIRGREFVLGKYLALKKLMKAF